LPAARDRHSPAYDCFCSPRRLLRSFAAAAVIAILHTASADAQTVIVRKAPADSTIEVVLNTTTVSTAKPDAAGEARLPVELLKTTKKEETDASMYIDVCDQTQRIVIVERGVTPPNQGTCERRSIAPLFLLRTITTMVIDLSGTGQTLRLRQGRAPDDWLKDKPVGVPVVRRLAPTGFVVSGGAGFSWMGGVVEEACGNVSNCSGDDSGLALQAAAGFWFGQYIGVEASYLEPPEVTVHGDGGTFRFDTALDAHVFGVAGKVAAAIGPVRIYGKIGPTYHRALRTTNETIDPVTIVTDDVVTTVSPGGTQIVYLNTQGWGWMFGGGLEGWLTNRVAIYGELERAAIKGDSRTAAQGSIDSNALSVLVGVRVHLGR
jgi:hypothetical protein